MRSAATRCAPRLSEEMHVRRLPRFDAPCRLMQIVTLLGEAGGAAARAHIDALAGDARDARRRSPANMRCWARRVTLVWERHTEFATYTLLRPGAFDDAVRPDAFRAASDRDPRRPARRNRPRDPDRARRRRRADPTPADLRTLVRRRGDRSSATSPTAARGSCPISGSTPTAMAACWCSTAGWPATSPRSWSCGCRNSAITATWRCSACRSRSG